MSVVLPPMLPTVLRTALVLLLRLSVLWLRLPMVKPKPPEPMSPDWLVPR